MGPGRARHLSRARLCVELAERLRARLPEIEQALLTRVHAVQRPGEVSNPAYAEGLRAAVSAGLGYALAGIGTGDPRPEPVPTELLAQARLAAAEGVALDTVLRRYLVGHTLLGDFTLQEVGEIDLSGRELQRLMRVQATLLEGLIATVASEHTRASEVKVRTADQRLASQVKQLLAGDLVSPAQLDYEFDLWHLGMVIAGPGAEGSAHALTAACGHRRLQVRAHSGAVWAWLGAAKPIAVEEVQRLGSASLPAEVTLALGEPARGIAGWRQTHSQAKAAIPLASEGTGNVVRYTEVALLAGALQDEVLATSLRDTFLVPLAAGRDGGGALRRTLRAYFAAGRNASSAAAELGVSRQTVNERLRKVEERLSRPIDTCAPELETALRLGDLEPSADS